MISRMLIFKEFIGLKNYIILKDDKYKDNMYTLLARYTLGYQIEYCLRTIDSCNIYCEC